MQQYSNKFGFDVMSGFYFKNRHVRDKYQALSKANGADESSADWIEWLECGNLLRAKYPYARAILAASFASPIVSILEHINIYYHACGSSLSGKTALLRFAMSIWGDPEQITFQYYATKAGLRDCAKMMDPLPLALDQVEFMIGKKKQLSAWVDMLTNPVSTPEMVSILSSGQATIPDRSEYRNQNIISTGEVAITDIAPDQKSNPSLLEVNADPLPRDVAMTLGHGVWLTANNGYDNSHADGLVGLAGQKFLTFLKHLPADSHETHRSIIVQALNAMIRTMKDELNVSFSARLDNASVLAVADYYASLGVFGIEDEKIAWQEAVELGKKIIAAE